MTNFVMARAYRGEPIMRIATERCNGLIYLANPERIEAVQAGASYPVGFPEEDVFALDKPLFQRLRSQWEATGATDKALWACASPATRAGQF